MGKTCEVESREHREPLRKGTELRWLFLRWEGVGRRGEGQLKLQAGGGWKERGPWGGSWWVAFSKRRPSPFGTWEGGRNE